MINGGRFHWKSILGQSQKTQTQRRSRWSSSHWGKDPTQKRWNWRGPINSEGYGVFNHEYRRSMAHWFAYELLIGPFPGDMVLDHLCRRRDCVSPEHLEAVTDAENVLRGIFPQPLTHCKWEHALDELNTRIRFNYMGQRRGRTCRTCER